MSGQWPPDWGDPDGEDAGAEAGQAEAGQADARLSAVTAYLAAQPAPVLPDAVQARISAAIAAAAADRAATAATSGRTLERDARRAKVRRRRRFSVRVIGSAAACLVIAGFGYLLTQTGGVSSSSSAASSPQAVMGPPVPAGKAEHAETSPYNAAVPAVTPAAAGVPSASAFAGSSARFYVTSRGDVYQESTLVSQVRERLRLASQPGNTGTRTGTGTYVASSALIGCVLRITDNTIPGLVDKATYAGKPVYVVAVSSRAWVVGRGCSATDPELITTVSLAALRGNLSALGSVDA